MSRAHAIVAGLALLAGSGPGHAQAAAARAAQVLAVIELPAVEVDGLKVREISALAWSPEDGMLYAASDKGRLFRYQLQWEAGRLGGAMPRGATALLSPRERRPMNIEALSWQRPKPGQPARLLLAAESDTNAWSIDLPLRAAHTMQPLAWPAAVAAALAAPGRHGVEAAEWHPAHGLLAATQRPLASASAAAAIQHVIHAADGAKWRLVAAGQQSDIKAIERIGDQRLLVLERIRGGVEDERRFVLRDLALSACVNAPCNPSALNLTSAMLDGRDNFEGMACPDDSNCLLVSDDGSAGAGTTKLVHIRLHRGPP